MVLGGQSAIGPMHISVGLPNQDSLCFGAYRSGFSFVAVADGVGSCRYSQEGSQKAVQVIRDLCKRGPKWLEDANKGAYLQKYIVSKWERSIGGNLLDYATTINFVIVGKKCVWLGQIGDGLILAQMGEHFLVLEETNAVPPYTFALGGIGAAENFRLYALKPCKQMSVFLSSDGIGRVLNPFIFSEFLSYMRKMILKNPAQAQKELKEWFVSLDKLNQDDKTFGVLLCR